MQKLLNALKQHKHLIRLQRKHAINLKRIAPMLAWSEKSYCAPSPFDVKVAVLLRLIQSGQHVVETGTYKGKTSLALHSAGHQVTTIEVHKPLFDEFSPGLTKDGINCILGDSGAVFETLLPKFVGKPVFFWLDGHYSGGITGKGDRDTPIVTELEHIRTQLLPTDAPVTIAIDDFRCFPSSGEQEDYPSRNYLVDWAGKNSCNWDVEHDIFVMKNH